MQATLAAIVVVALKGLYLQVRDIYKYYRLSLADMVSDYICIVRIEYIAVISFSRPIIQLCMNQNRIKACK